MKSMRILLPLTLTLLLLAACGGNPTKQELDNTNKIAATYTTKDPVPQTQTIPAVTPAQTITPTPIQVTSNSRVDFKSAEHLAASKDRLAKDYPDHNAKNVTGSSR